jgi:hypothetical protein
MHASSSLRPYATRTSLAMTGPEPQIIRCQPAHDVRVLFAYDELLVRGTLALPSSSIRWQLLIPVLSGICAFENIASLLLVRDQGYAPSVHPFLPRSFTPEQIALRRLSSARALSPAPHNRNTSDSYQCDIGCISSNTTCILALHPSRLRRRRTHRRGRCLAEVLCSMRHSALATLSSSVRLVIFKAAGLSQVLRFPLPPFPFLRLSSSSLTLRQPLALSIHKTSDVLLAAACG